MTMWHNDPILIPEDVFANLFGTSEMRDLWRLQVRNLVDGVGLFIYCTDGRRIKISLDEAILDDADIDIWDAIKPAFQAQFQVLKARTGGADVGTQTGDSGQTIQDGQGIPEGRASDGEARLYGAGCHQ